jgi:flagellin
VYSGNLADYTITHNADGTITVTDNNTADGLDEGSDTLSNIEAIEFADQTYDTASQTSSATLTSAMTSGTPAAGITPGTSTATGSSGSGSSGGSGGSSDPHGYGALFGVGGSTALAMIDKAIDTVSLERAKLGAILNRLDSRKSSLLSEMENTKSSISKIQDADFAMETARLIKEQIRQKVASAMLSYANSSMQQLTKLLK